MKFELGQVFATRAALHDIGPALIAELLVSTPQYVVVVIRLAAGTFRL